MVGSKRYIAPMPRPEPEPKKVEKSRTVPPQRPREPYVVSKPYVAPKASPSTPSSGGSKSQYTLNDGNKDILSSYMYLLFTLNTYQTHTDQKGFIKHAKDTNMEMRYEQYNPKNAKGASYDRYEKYKAGRTIAEALKLGAKSADIPYDYSRGYITFPEGGQYATFSSMGNEAPSKPPRQKSEPPPPQIQREKPMKQETHSAFDISPDDVKEVTIAREVIDYGLAGGETLKLAEAAYESREMETCMHHLERGLKEEVEYMVSSEMKRLRALVQFHSLLPSKSSVKGSRSTEVGRNIHFGGDLPTLHETPSRDLAKETRQENHLRHEPRGVVSLFDARLREMLDELFNNVNSPVEEESDSDLTKATFELKDVTESFKLHKRSPMPSCAKLPDQEVRYKGCDVDGMVEMLTTAKGGEQIGSKDWSGVDKYGKFGLTPLSIAARLGRDDLVETLVKLGADSLNAIDGATYLSERTRDLGWIVGLLKSLHTLPSLISPDQFLKLAQHTRKRGDTPLLVAVNNKDVAAARQLLEWGAVVDAPGQRRSSDQASCLDVARERNTPGMLELLSEYNENKTTL